MCVNDASAFRIITYQKQNSVALTVHCNWSTNSFGMTKARKKRNIEKNATK